MFDRNVLSVLIGNDECCHPFKASIFNIKIKNNVDNTIEKEGTKMDDGRRKTFAKKIDSGKFTGGEEIFQITPEYSGCKTDNGTFSKAQFMQNACLSEIKMIELDLSGTANARHQDFSTCKIGRTTRMSTSTAFSTLGYREFAEAEGMLHFLDTLRECSDRKPVGIKLCIGSKEFHEICYSFRKTGLIPDFIVVGDANAGEESLPQTKPSGNTRMRLYEALLFVSKTLQTYGLEKQIKIIASASILSAFDVLKILALGADMVYSEMPAHGLVNQHENGRLFDTVQDSVNFHNNIMNNIATMMEACGFKSVCDLSLSNFFRKLDELQLTALQAQNSSLVNSDWQNVS